MDVDCSEFENLKATTPRPFGWNSTIKEVLADIKARKNQDKLGIKHLPYDDLTQYNVISASCKMDQNTYLGTICHFRKFQQVGLGCQ